MPKAVKKEVRNGLSFLSLCPFSKYRSSTVLSNQDAAVKETENAAAFPELALCGGRQTVIKRMSTLYRILEGDDYTEKTKPGRGLAWVELCPLPNFIS